MTPTSESTAKVLASFANARKESKPIHSLLSISVKYTKLGIGMNVRTFWNRVKTKVRCRKTSLISTILRMKGTSMIL